jgi:xylulokinase
MATYLIGIDIGTSGTKSVVMDTEGKLIASSLKTYDVLTPRALWAEQWPEVWLEACNASIRELVQKIGPRAAKIAGIAVSGLYGGSGIPLDGDLRPCLIWMDRRAQAEEKWVLEHIGLERIRRITHNGTDPYYGYTKILWIKNNEPENWAKTKLFLPPQCVRDLPMDRGAGGGLFLRGKYRRRLRYEYPDMVWGTAGGDGDSPGYDAGAHR